MAAEPESNVSRESSRLSPQRAGEFGTCMLVRLGPIRFMETWTLRGPPGLSFLDTVLELETLLSGVNTVPTFDPLIMLAGVLI